MTSPKKEECHSELSKHITSILTSATKKGEGIFFTSKPNIKKNIELLVPFMPNIKTVLEPSSGSGEYILELNKLYPNLDITAIEQNETIYNTVRDKMPQNTKLIKTDYIGLNTLPTYDLIITNPPYIVLKQSELKKNKQLDTYKDYYTGRPNLFILFIIKSLKLLNQNGILSFILPNNFLSCLYYDKTRQYINENYTILHIVNGINDYIDTAQETIIIIIQNKAPVKNINSKFVLNNDNTIFGLNENIEKIAPLYNNSTTLAQLDFKVNVGSIVWNQHKDILTDDASKTRLIYSSDIVNNTLILKQYKNDEKQNYIDHEGITEPVLVINRGYGKSKYKFNYCLINKDTDTPYLIENHLICIKYNKNISKDKLIDLYNKIIKSLQDKRTEQFIELYFTNNAINTVELNNILPIYI